MGSGKTGGSGNPPNWSLILGDPLTLVDGGDARHELTPYLVQVAHYGFVVLFRVWFVLFRPLGGLEPGGWDFGVEALVLAEGKWEPHLDHQLERS